VENIYAESGYDYHP